MARGLQARGKTGLLLELTSHRVKPSEVFIPRLPGATARLLARRRSDRTRILREVGTLLAQDVRRRWLNRRPAYAEDGTLARDAGPTEVEDSAVA
jgi:hypothetical protein